MISPSYSIEEFVVTIADKDYRDILLLTEREATEVERQLYKSHSINDAEQTGAKTYVESLKEILSYMICSIRPSKSCNPHFSLFEAIFKKV